MSNFQGFGSTWIHVPVFKRKRKWKSRGMKKWSENATQRTKVIQLWGRSAVLVKSGLGKRKYGLFGFKDKKSYNYYTKEGGVYAR